MKSGKVFFSIGFTILIVLGCIIWYNNSRLKFKVVEIDQIYKEASENNYSILHIGALSNSDKEILKRLQTEYDFQVLVSNTTFEIASKYIEKDYSKETRFVVFVNAEIVGMMEVDKDYNYYTEKLDKYFYHVIPNDEALYTVPKTAQEFINDAQSKNYTVAVFGYSSCSYCTLYKPILNEIVYDYGIKIYYFDSSTYDQDQYDIIRETKYTIPAKCTSKNKDLTLEDSIAAPMTLIIKGGKTVDCIKGYVSKTSVEDVLKKYNIIKEK